MDPTLILKKLIGDYASKKAVENVDNIKDRIREFLTNDKLAACPEDNKASKLDKIRERQIYKRFIECVGIHRTESIVCAGIYLSELSIDDSNKEIEEINRDVNQRYGPRGWKVLKMGSTGVIYDVISYLDDLRKKDASQEDIVRVYERILDEWEEIAIFVKKGQNDEEVITECNRIMDQKKSFFFVFAIGERAYKPAVEAIIKLQQGDIFRQKGYMLMQGESPRRGNVRTYRCIVEKIETLDLIDYGLTPSLPDKGI